MMAKFDPYMGFIPKIMQLFVLLLGGLAVIKGNMTLGVLTAFIQYANNIVWPMQNMGWLTNSLAAGIASNKKINKILAEEAGIKDAPDAVKDADPDGEISFNDVSFSMNGRKILDGISFELPVGKHSESWESPAPAKAPLLI